MKKITILNVFKFKVKEKHSGLKDIFVEGMDQIEDTNNNMEVSDGYHTFDELYEHRITLFIAMCRVIAGHDRYVGTTDIWRSKLHSDGTSFNGWFILGITKESGEQITYHLPLSKWDETDFAETLEKAPEWDGHTSQDVLKRLKEL